MSGQEVLNQDEIDALLNGVDAGVVSTEPAADRFRRQHERWLTRTLMSGHSYPVIPARQVARGGFDSVRQRPRARDLADRWWSMALLRVDLTEDECA